jgi:hypothetical protein
MSREKPKCHIDTKYGQMYTFHLYNEELPTCYCDASGDGSEEMILISWKGVEDRNISTKNSR